MNKRVLQDIEGGPRHHEVAVENLAQSLKRPKERVTTLYRIVLRHYSRTARIKYFLSALVSKRVKDVLRDDAPPCDIECRRGHSREL
ncbi:MAG TPA: DUF3562 domain-containing protein [Nitrospirota bacterium]|nr:DUF3562 domain-containing protein [Nitrospirota bacterium]